MIGWPKSLLNDKVAYCQTNNYIGNLVYFIFVVSIEIGSLVYSPLNSTSLLVRVGIFAERNATSFSLIVQY